MFREPIEAEAHSDPKPEIADPAAVGSGARV